MKKTLILWFLLATLVAGSTLAGSSIGLKLGVTASRQHYDYSNIDDPKLDWRHDIECGLLAEVTITGGLSARGEVSYVTKGMKVNMLTTNYFGYPTIVPSSNYVRYVSISLLLKARLPVSWGQFYALAGPRIDKQVSYHGETVFKWRYDDFESSVFGVTVGLGQELQIGQVAIFLEGLYHHDFGYAYKLQTLTVHNRAFSILVGIRI